MYNANKEKYSKTKIIYYNSKPLGLLADYQTGILSKTRIVKYLKKNNNFPCTRCDATDENIGYRVEVGGFRFTRC